jgi:hypothetical protein
MPRRVAAARWAGRVARLILHRLLTHASRCALHVRVAHRKHRDEEISHEGLVSHRSAVRSRDLRNDPALSASNAAWSRTDRRWGEGHHLRARPPSPAAGGETRVSTRATGCPSRLLILFERERAPTGAVGALPWSLSISRSECHTILLESATYRENSDEAEMVPTASPLPV